MKILLLMFGFALISCTETSKAEKESVISELNIEKKKVENSNRTSGYNQIEVGRKVLYTGQRKIDNGDTKTNGIDIKKITETQIEYTYTQLINWKKEFDINGVANLISISDSIITRKETKEVAFKFIDPECDIVIYVTKNGRANNTKCKVYNKTGKEISELLHHK